MVGDRSIRRNRLIRNTGGRDKEERQTLLEIWGNRQRKGCREYARVESQMISYGFRSMPQPSPHEAKRRGRSHFQNTRIGSESVDDVRRQCHIVQPLTRSKPTAIRDGTAQGEDGTCQQVARLVVLGNPDYVVLRSTMYVVVVVVVTIVVERLRELKELEWRE
jgi:hypothetical protein